MLEQGQLKKQIQALNSGDEPARREGIQALKLHERADWDALTLEQIRPVIEALRKQLPKSQENGAKPPLFRQEVVTTLGNIGPRAEAALP